MDEIGIYIAILMLFMAVIVMPLLFAFGNHGPKCPKCGTPNTVQRLNFVSEEDRKTFYAYDDDGEVETFVDCKKCGHRYVHTYVLPQAPKNNSWPY